MKKRKLISVILALTLCLMMFPAVSMAAEWEWPEEGNMMTVGGVKYVYGGDVTKTGLTLESFYGETLFPANTIYKAGEGAITCTLEEGLLSMTMYDALVDNPEGNAITVSGYDLVVSGVGVNKLYGSECGIQVTDGCLTITGDIEEISGNGGIQAVTSYGILDSGEVEMNGGDILLNGNIGRITGVEQCAVEGCMIIIAGSVDMIRGCLGISATQGHGSAYISGRIGEITGTLDSAIAALGTVTIDTDAVIGDITGAYCGITSEAVLDENNNLVSPAGVAILGKTGNIITETAEDDNDLIGAGIRTVDGNILIGKSAVVKSVRGGWYGIECQAGTVTIDGAVTDGISGEEEDIHITEKPSLWARTEVNDAIWSGIVPEELQSGYTAPATRAEYCALATALYEKIKGEITERKTFSDTEDINVEKMAAIGVVNGVGEDRFAPDNKLTREQAAAMLSRLAESLDEALPAAEPGFADNGDIFPYAYDAVGQVQAAGIMKGVSEDRFSPKGDYTKEQSIITMNRLFEIVRPADEDITE